MDQHEARPVVAFGDRCKNRGWTQFVLGAVNLVGQFDVLRVTFGVKAGKAFYQVHAGTSEKRAPWLVTVRSASARSTSCSQVLRLIRASVPWRTAR